MAKRRTFNPTIFKVQIGDNEYVIAPQPLEKILQFDDALDELSIAFDGLADKVYVTNDGDDLAEFLTMEDAESYIADNDLVETATTRYEGVSFRDFLNRLISSPHVALKPLIPDLREEDIRKVSLPELEFILQLLIEVNGFKWFEKLIKNVVEPLLPQIAAAASGAAGQVLKSSTRMGMEKPGEKQ